MKEQDLVNQIRDWMTVQGAYNIRVNSGGKPVEKPDGTRYMIRGADKGTPDIIACWPGGLFCGIECKMPGNTPTPDQIAALEKIRDAGGLAVVAYSIEDIQDALKERMRA